MKVGVNQMWRRRRRPVEPRRIGSSLAVRNYRLYFFGQLVSVAGTWMQTVAQSFLVLRLTGSGTALGLATAVRFLPMFLAGPLGGLVADRLDKRRILYVTQTISGLLAAVFAILIATGSIEMWMVYLMALALGCVNVFDNPARQSFIGELVPPAHLSNAVTLNSVAMNMARVFGAALGGVFVAALGLATCFALNAVSFAAVLISLLLMRGGDLYPSRPAPKEKGQVRAGIRYALATPELIVPLVMIAVIGTLAWEFQVSLPLMARDTFHRGAGAYGLMASVMGAGAVVGGLITASREKSARPGAVPGGHGLGGRHPGRSRGPEPAARAGCSALRGLRQHHVQLDGQNHAATRGRPGDARPRHGPMGPGLARIDADRRTHRRLGRPGVRGPLVAGDRRIANRADRAGRLARPQANRRAGQGQSCRSGRRSPIRPGDRQRRSGDGAGPTTGLTAYGTSTMSLGAAG